MLKLFSKAFFAAILFLPMTALAMQQAYLVQNSGWMEPFYKDSESQFKPLIKAVIAATVSSQDVISVAAFNQSLPGNPSPKLVYQGVAGGNYSSAIDMIDLARKSAGGSYADTDLNEAIKATIINYFNGRPGIIWLFSNNKNSPGNSQDTARKNQEFYYLLHREPAIRRVLAFPIGMAVQGNYYRSSGAMIYALAYGKEASDYLTRLQQSGQIGRVLNQAPARLKPLDAEPVRLLPVGVVGNDQVTAELASDQRSLILNVDAGSRLPVATVKTRMINDFSPYVISQASVSARFRGNGWNDPLSVSVSMLEKLKPGESVEVEIGLPMPLAEIPSIWSPLALGSAGKQFTLPAVVEIQLSNQKLAVDSNYIQRLNTLFPGDPLPAVFAPPEEIQNSIASIPVYLKISYPLYPLVLVVLAVLALLALLALILLAAGNKTCAISVNGERRNATLGAFKSMDIKEDGQVVASLKRSVGGVQVVAVQPGNQVKILR